MFFDQAIPSERRVIGSELLVWVTLKKKNFPTPNEGLYRSGKDYSGANSTFSPSSFFSIEI